jgi:hypothetical protein
MSADEITWVTIPAAILTAMMDEVDAMRAERAAFHRLILQHWKLFGEQTAVTAELTNDAAHRRFLHESHRRAAREVKRLSLDLWFWRAEREGREPADVQAMLSQRARYLTTEQRRTSVDDVFDLLTEFATDVLKLATPEDFVKQSMIAASKGVS